MKKNVLESVVYTTYHWQPEAGPFYRMSTVGAVPGVHVSTHRSCNRNKLDTINWYLYFTDEFFERLIPEHDREATTNNCCEFFFSCIKNALRAYHSFNSGLAEEIR